MADSTTTLETLSTKVVMDASQFLTAQQEVIKATLATGQAFTAMATTVATAASSIVASMSGMAVQINAAMASTTAPLGLLEKMKATAQGLRNSMRGLAQTDLKRPIGALKDLASHGRSLATALGKVSSSEPALHAIGELLSGTGLKPGAVTMTLPAVFNNIAASVNNLATHSPMLANVTADFKNFIKAINASNLPALDDRVKAVSRLASAMARMGKNSDTLPMVGQGITSFAQNLGNVAQLVNPAVTELTRSFARIGTFSNSINNTNVRKMRSLVTDVSLPKGGIRQSPLGQFAEEFSKIATKFATVDVTTASKSLGKIGTFLNSVAEVARVNDPSKLFKQINRGLSNVFSTMDKAGTSPNLENAGMAMSRTGMFVRAITKLNPGQLDAFSASVARFVHRLGNSPSANAMESAKALSRVGAAVKNMAMVDPAKTVAAAKGTQAVMAILNKIPVNPQVFQVANAMSRVSAAMRGLSSVGSGGIGGGGGGGDGRNNSPAGWFNSITPAANRATVATGNFGQALKSLFMASDSAGFVGLQRIQMTMMGMGVLGVVQFARMDNELLRVEAHMKSMGTWREGDRQMLQRGVNEMTSQRITGPGDLAKGLDKLATSGMSAAMALRALGVAEDFATVSQMPMQKATERLVDVMAAMGLDAKDPNKHLENMRHVADTVFGLAAKSGSNEEQFTEAFTVRLSTAMKSVNVPFDDAAAMIAVYSKLGNPGRGAAGGTRIARAMEGIASKSVSGHEQWKAILPGAYVNDVRRPGFDVVQELAAKLGPVGSDQRRAQLMKLDLDTDLMTALEPLLQHAAAMKTFRDSINGMGDASTNAANLLRGGLLSQMRILFNAVASLASEFGERLAPIIYYVSNAITQMSLAFYQLNPAYQTMIAAGVLIWAAWWPATMLLSTLVSSLLGIASTLLFLPFYPLILVARGLFAIGSAISLVFQGVGFVVDVLSGIVAGLFMVAKTAVSVFSTVASTLWTVAKVAAVAFESLFSIIPTMITLVSEFASVTWQIIKHIGTLIASAVTNALVSIMTIMATVLVSMIAYSVLIGPLVFIIAAALAVVGGVIVTIWMVAKQLASAVGGALVHAWNMFLQAAKNALVWTKNALVGVGESMIDVWKNMQEGLDAFIQNVGIAAAKISGFFWNIRENAKTIWDFMMTPGGHFFKDLLTAFINVIGYIATAITNVFMFLGNTLWTGMQGIWFSLTSHAKIAFSWLRSNWSSLMSDMGSITQALFVAIGTNAVKLIPYIRQYLESLVDEQAKILAIHAKFHWSFLTDGGDPEAVRKAIKEVAEEAANRRALIIPDMQLNYKPVGMDLSKVQWKTPGLDDEGGLGSLFKFTDNNITRMWTGIGRTIGTEFVALFNGKSRVTVLPPEWERKTNDALRPSGLGTAFTAINTLVNSIAGSVTKKGPLGGAFDHILNSPAWQNMFKNINLTLPNDAKDKALEWFNKVLFPSDPQGGAGDALGQGSGIGFQSKQISLERMMINGPAAENLDYQQLVTLKAIDGKLGVLLLSRGGVPSPLGN